MKRLLAGGARKSIPSALTVGEISRVTVDPLLMMGMNWFVALLRNQGRVPVRRIVPIAVAVSPDRHEYRSRGASAAAEQQSRRQDHEQQFTFQVSGQCLHAR